MYGCYDDTAITVTVYPYIFAKFTIDRSAICSDEVFSIDRSGSTGAINHYYWDYQNDGITDEDKTMQFSVILIPIPATRPEPYGKTDRDECTGL
jgi:hypothetical protein